MGEIHLIVVSRSYINASLVTEDKGWRRRGQLFDGDSIEIRLVSQDRKREQIEGSRGFVCTDECRTRASIRHMSRGSRAFTSGHSVAL